MSHCVPLAALALGAALAGCTASYAYTFHVVDPGVQAAAGPAGGDRVEDDIVTADLRVADDSIALDLTNKTTEPLQVEWNEIAIDRGDGTQTRLRPTDDLGWISPGATAKVQLVPFAVPRTGAAAARYEGRRLELSVPVIAHREPKTYRFHFVAHVHQL